MRKSIRVLVPCLAIALSLAGCSAAHKPTSLATLPPPETPGIAIPDGQIDKAIGQIDQLARTLLAETRIPGMAIAVVKDGKVAYAKGFGVRAAGQPETVNADTVFQLASLSKPVGATVVASQIGAGKITWDTPLVQHLPWFALHDPWVTRHLTVGDMYAHRSGLPDHAGDELEDLGYTRRQVLERLRYLPNEGFRNHYAYTNFGLTAAAEAVAVAAGRDWADLTEQALFQPLGMSSTSSRYADFARRANRAQGHVRIDGAYRPRYQRLPDAQAAAGGVSSSVNDMAKWMIMVLHNGTVDGRQIVPASALLPAVSPQVVSGPPATPSARAGFYGYGFGIGNQPSGRTILSHSGAFLLGASTNFVLIPSADVGIVILTNAAPVGAAESIGMEFADLVQYGTITRDWRTAFAGVFASMAEPFGSLVGKAPPARAAPPQDLSTYVGTYANAYFGDATITTTSEGLRLVLGPAKAQYDLRHWDGSTFVFALSGENASPGSVSAAVFSAPLSGRARALTIEFYDQDGLGTFVRHGAG